MDTGFEDNHFGELGEIYVKQVENKPLSVLCKCLSVDKASDLMPAFSRF